MNKSEIRKEIATNGLESAIDLITRKYDLLAMKADTNRDIL